MTINIIGGNGFLGTNLSDLLKIKSYSYKIFDKSLKNENYVDITSPQTLNNISPCDVLINLAAEHRDDVFPKSLYDDVNVEGSRNICEYAKNNNINKIIFTSSVAIYGFAPPNTDESGKANYFNDYGRTKFLAEQIYKDWQAEDPEKRTLVIIRPTVIFGEGNRGNVYNLLKQIASRKFVMIGKGGNIKSMAYVKNVASFIEHSMSLKPGFHLYNYIDKPDFDMNTLVSNARSILFGKKNVGLRLPAFLGFLIGYLADGISFITRKKLPISSIRVKKFLKTTQFQSSINNTNFHPPFKLHDALLKTIEYEFLEDNSNNRTFETE